MNRLNPQQTIIYDIEDIELRDHEKQLLNFAKLCEAIKYGHFNTLLSNEGLIVAVVGYIEPMKGVLDVMVIPSIHVPDFALPFLRYVKTVLNSVAATVPAHRMQTFSKADPQTDKWMKILGFECEGTMKQFTTDKQDYRIWARLIHERQ